MLRSMNSPSDDDQHLRHLLDQRSARANHGCYPSISELSDSPSVYSHAYFSPPPLDKAELDANTRAFNFDIPPRRRLDSSNRSIMSDRERLNDPTASGLDLEDDPRSSVAYSDIYDDDVTLDEDGIERRMSMLGPKMRFHSRAPWETEDILLEEDESDHSSNSKAPSLFHRGRGNAPVKTLAPLRTRRSSGSRPSAESVHLQANAKKSLDSHGSQSSGSGALQVTQAPLSLALPAPGSYTNHTSSGPSSPHPSPSSPRSAPLYHHVSHMIPQDGRNSPSSATFGRLDIPSPSNCSSSSHSEEYVHPYANPAFATSYTPPSPIPRNDSFASKMKSSTLNPVSRSVSVSTLTPNSPGSSVPSSRRDRSVRPSPIQGREISLPIAVSNSAFRSSDASSNSNETGQDVKLLPPSNSLFVLNGWQDHPASPTVTLISLEEAQAQAKERSRSATTHSVLSQQAASATGRIPFPESEQDTHVDMRCHTDDNLAGRARARSTSAGARAKHVLQNMVSAQPKLDLRDSDSTSIQIQLQSQYSGGTSGKGLKHKKSGFMRLFNGREQRGRERDRDYVPPPPVPHISDSIFSQSISPNSTVEHIQGLQLSSSTKILQSTVATDISTNSSEGRSLDSHRSDSRPGISPLTIATSPQFQSPPSATVSKPMQGHKGPPLSAADFPSLSLRPVSTFFSAHFADHIVNQDGESRLDADVETSGSSSPTMSGHFSSTPRFAGHTVTDELAVNIPPEDQSSVIQSLQDQIVSARKIWQRQIWELEGQVRDLKAEVEDLRAIGNDKDRCEVCGRGNWSRSHGEQPIDGGMSETKKFGVVNRPRARTGTAARFGSAV